MPGTKGSLKVERKSFVRPASSSSPAAAPVPEVELCGVDAMCMSINVRLALYFDHLISKEVLKSTLAEVLDKFPLLASREEKRTYRYFCPLDARGAQVFEQHLVLTDAPALNPLQPYLPKLVRGKAYAKSGDPVTILTLTEVEYEAARPFSCRPAACRSKEEEDEVTENASAKETPAKGNSPMQRPRFVIGICINHNIADGCSINQFLMCWALASIKRPFPPPSSYDRGLLLNTQVVSPEDGSLVEPKLPSLMATVGLLGKAQFIASMLMDRYTYTHVSYEFPPSELEAIKAAAMAPLQGTGSWVSTSNALAAHLWPILTELMPGGKEGEEDLCGLSMVINTRKHMKIHPTYFGNCASVKQVATGSVGDSLTDLALKIRQTCVADSNLLLAEAAYLEQAKREGRMGSLAFTPMMDAIQGRRAMMWDDVSGFDGPAEPAASSKIGFAGVPVMGMDIYFEPMAGMAMVSPILHGDGGKRLLFCVHKKQLDRALSPEFQRRVHAFRPPPVKQVAPSEAEEEETKSEPTEVVVE